MFVLVCLLSILHRIVYALNPTRLYLGDVAKDYIIQPQSHLSYLISSEYPSTLIVIFNNFVAGNDYPKVPSIYVTATNMEGVQIDYFDSKKAGYIFDTPWLFVPLEVFQNFTINLSNEDLIEEYGFRLVVMQNDNFKLLPYVSLPISFSSIEERKTYTIDTKKELNPGALHYLEIVVCQGTIQHLKIMGKSSDSSTRVLYEEWNITKARSTLPIVIGNNDTEITVELGGKTSIARITLNSYIDATSQKSYFDAQETEEELIFSRKTSSISYTLPETPVQTKSQFPIIEIYPSVEEARFKQICGFPKEYLSFHRLAISEGGYESGKLSSLSPLKSYAYKVAPSEHGNYTFYLLGEQGLITNKLKPYQGTLGVILKRLIVVAGRRDQFLVSISKSPVLTVRWDDEFNNDLAERAKALGWAVIVLLVGCLVWRIWGKRKLENALKKERAVATRIEMHEI